MAQKDPPEQSGSDASNDRNYRSDGQGMLNFDDELGSGPGNNERTGGNWAAQGGDSEDGGEKRPS
jgi:hypothetical protein